MGGMGGLGGGPPGSQKPGADKDKKKKKYEPKPLTRYVISYRYK